MRTAPRAYVSVMTIDLSEWSAEPVPVTSLMKDLHGQTAVRDNGTTHCQEFEVFSNGELDGLEVPPAPC